jgi:hypothetical protein
MELKGIWFEEWTGFNCLTTVTSDGFLWIRYDFPRRILLYVISPQGDWDTYFIWWYEFLQSLQTAISVLFFFSIIGLMLFWRLYIQSDSFTGSPELIIINNMIIYQWKCKLASTYLGRWGDNWVTDDAELSLLLPGEWWAQCSTFVSSFHSSTCGTTVWSKRHEVGWMSLAQCAVLPSFHFIGKLLCDIITNLGPPPSESPCNTNQAIWLKW